MSNKVNGCFYFKQTSNGNLIGEYTHDNNPLIWTESAHMQNIKDNNEAPYIGEYKSTWHEKGNEFYLTTLNIFPNEDPKSKKYILTWEGNNFYFIGDGMFCDNILIGYYRSASKNEIDELKKDK